MGMQLGCHQIKNGAATAVRHALLLIWCKAYKSHFQGTNAVNWKNEVNWQGVRREHAQLFSAFTPLTNTFCWR
jgi:hypothetical protein